MTEAGKPWLPEQGVGGVRNSAYIMVVEDESIIAMDLVDQLEDLGHQVCGVADNSVEAQLMAATKRPDLILMDVVIKGTIDGIDTAAIIHQRWGIPVIFLTAFGDQATVRRATEAAPYGYLKKPFNRRELATAIEVAMQKHRLEQRLIESERWLAATVRCVDEAVLTVDAQGLIRSLNPAAEELLGASFDTVRGEPLEKHLQLMDASTHKLIDLPKASQLQAVQGSVKGVGHLLTTRGGATLQIDHSATAIRSLDGQAMGMVMALRNVSARVASAAALRESESRFRAVFEFAPVGMALIGLNGDFLQVNPALCAALQYLPEVLLELNHAEVTDPEDQATESQHLMRLHHERDVRAVRFDKRYLPMRGEPRWMEVSVSLLRPENGVQCYLYQLHDVHERRMAESRLAALATTDPLTGLANRTRLLDALQRELVTAHRRGDQLALVFIDLDHFKVINDTLGHEAGDVLLKAMAGRMQSSVRANDIVARLGGDEFVVLITQVRSLADVHTVTDKLQAQVRLPVDINGVAAHVGLSMGVSLFPDDASDANGLLQCADSALYYAKEQGRGQVQFYQPAFTQRLRERMMLDAELRSGLQRGEFVLHYQPVLPLNGGRGLQVEVYIRWQHPQRGLLEPGAFLAYAEESGLIDELGHLVLTTACADALHMHTAAGHPVGVSVNLSARQFKLGRLVGSTEQALAASGLKPQQLALEISESELQDETEQTLSAVRALQNMGASVALHGYGVGVSSLRSIRRFGVSTLKVDRSLITACSATSDGAVVVNAVVGMARSLGLDLVAVGVETGEQHEFLRQAGCAAGQGHFYAKPMVLLDLLPWLAQYQVDPGSLAPVPPAA